MGCLVTLVGFLFAGILAAVYASMGCFAALLAVLIPVAIATFYVVKTILILAMGFTIVAALAAYGGAYYLFNSGYDSPWIVGIGTVILGSFVLFGLYSWLFKNQ